MRVCPSLGGAIASLSHARRDILRPTAEGAVDMFNFACFPLVPYVNRIAGGRFLWDGQGHLIAPNHPGHAQPLHGLGWLRPWDVLVGDDATLTMEMRHRGDAAWPWAFRAVQTIALAQEGLRATLSLRNEGVGPMPWSLGFHPYFARTPGDRLEFSAEGMWLVDADMLPFAHAAADALGDWAKAQSLNRPTLVDHCYTEWNGRARISRSDYDLVLTGRNTPHLHLYVPPAENFFCAEPVTAIPNALNFPPVPMLGPGECKTAEMGIAMIG